MRRKMTKMISTQIAIGAVHHLTLTVTDLDRSTAFYIGILGFRQVMTFGSRAILSNSQLILALTPPPNSALAAPDDRFDENRIGLDHLSFTVESRAALEAAQRLFDERGISHGQINDLGPDLSFYVLAFRDPDNIQLELTAPYG
jgi:glyoxylase I family protein